MKICLLFSRFPWPETGGDVIRVNRVAQYLKSKGHVITLLSFHDGYNDTTYISGFYDKIVSVKRHKLFSVCYSFYYVIRRKPIQCGYYYSPIMNRVFKNLVKESQFDRYICWDPRMGAYIQKSHLEAKTIMELSDATSKTYQLSSQSKSKGLKKFIYAIERKPMYNEEQKVIFQYPKVVLVAQPDIDYLKDKAGRDVSSLFLHTIGVDVRESVSVNYDQYKICFVGNMRTLQNQDAAIRFVKDILPLIVKDYPDVRFYIAGAEPSEKILELADNKNVFVTGFLNNLLDFISDSCMTVAPVTVAAGIQNKVLMSMGMGVPVVMSCLISHAIPELKNGENCFISDDVYSFADNVKLLLSNRNIRMSMSEKGLMMVRKYYSWSERLDKYELFPYEMNQEPNNV